MGTAAATFPELFFKQVAEQKDRIALRRKEFGIWQRISWQEYGRRVQETAAAMIAMGTADRRTSSRETGLRTSFPEVERPPPSNSVGAWTLTSFCSSGTSILCLHFGQGPDLPANLSSTRKLL